MTNLTISPEHEKLRPEEVERGMHRVIQEGFASQTMESLTTGIFMVGVALHFGASNFIIGLLGAIPFLGNLFQILAIPLVDKHRDRRKIVASTSFIARCFLLSVVFLPFIDDTHLSLTLLIIAMTFRYSIGALATCAWNSWMRDLIPEKELGKFFGNRLFYLTVIACILSLGAGSFIDWWGKAYPEAQGVSYAILYGLGFIAAMTSSYMILTIPHPPMPLREVKDYTRYLSFSYLKAPLYHENFRRLMLFLMSWSFAINLAAPFFTVYMLKTLGYDMASVVAITLVSQIVNALFLRFWGRYADLYSNKTILRICGTLFVFCILGWIFTPLAGTPLLTTSLLVTLHVLMGLSTAGVTLSSGNIALKLAPQHEATSYLAVNSMLSSFAAGIAPLVGGAFADFYLTMDFHWRPASGDVVVQTLTIGHWNFFFLLSFMLGLYSLRRLAFITEEGAVHEHVVIRELMMDTGKILRSVSTVSGIRELTLSPLLMMVTRLKRRH